MGPKAPINPETGRVDWDYTPPQRVLNLPDEEEEDMWDDEGNDWDDLSQKYDDDDYDDFL